MDYSQLAARITALRKENGMTQKQLAELLSVTDKTVSKWETGYTVPDVEMLDKLAKVFGCTMDELVHGVRADASSSVESEAPREQTAVAPDVSDVRGNKFSRGAVIGVVACLVVGLVVLFVCLGVFVWAKHPLAVEGVGERLAGVQIDEDTRIIRATADSETDSFAFSDMDLSSYKATVSVYADAAMTSALDPDVHLYAGDNVYYVRVTDGDRTVAYTVIIVRNVDFETHVHVAGEWSVLFDSTCVDAGEKQTVCTDCGLSYTEVIPANGHTEVTDAAVAATCTATGLTEGKHCAVCGAVLVAQSEVAKRDHDYVDGVCVHCGAREEASIISLPEPTASEREARDIALDMTAHSTSVRAVLGLGEGETGRIVASVERTSGDSSAYAALDVMRISAESEPDAGTDANVFYIGIHTTDDASDAQIVAAEKAAAEYLYTLFVQINSGHISNKAVIILQSGLTLDASAHEWRAVKYFGGYLGSAYSTSPATVKGVRLTEATMYADTVVLGGSGGKYFLSGFICALYGNATVENLTFTSLSIDHPARDYDDALTEKQHSRNTTALIGGVIDDPASGTAGRSVTDVTLRNITLDDTCAVKGAATAAGLVGYVGSCGEEDIVDKTTVKRRLFNGILTIDNCHVSATIEGGPETATYGPCGGLVGFTCRCMEEGHAKGQDCDLYDGELYTIIIEDCTFDGNVTGYQGVGSAVGDMITGVVIFQGTNDFTGATLTSVDPAGSNMVGVVGRANKDAQVAIYFSTATVAAGTVPAIGCLGNIGAEAHVSLTTDVDTRAAAKRYDTVKDTLGNPIGGNNGVIDIAIDDGTGDGSVYNLRVWCAEEDVDMIWEMLCAYADKYKDNTYNWTVERQAEDLVASSVLRDVEAAPDVFSFANDQLGNLLNQNALIEIPAACTPQIDNQIDMARVAAQYNGSYYAIPYSYENCFLYYNKSLVSAEQVASMDSLLNASIAGVTFNLGIDMADSYYTTMFLYTAGVEIFGAQGNDPSSVDLANDNAVKACRYIASLSGKNKFASIAKADQYAALKNGRVAAIIGGPNMIRQFKDALGANFGVAMLPTIRFAGDTKDSQLIGFSGVKMYGVSRRSTAARTQKTTAEAIKLAAYLANATNQQKRLNDRAYCPTDCDLFEAAVESGIPTVEVEVAQSEHSKLKPGLKQMSNYWENMAVFLLGVYKLSYKESDWLVELKKIEDKLKE